MGQMCGFLEEARGSKDTQSTVEPKAVETNVGHLSGVMRKWCAHVASVAVREPEVSIFLLKNFRFYQPRLLLLPGRGGPLGQRPHVAAAGGL